MCLIKKYCLIGFPVVRFDSLFKKEKKKWIVFRKRLLHTFIKYYLFMRQFTYLKIGLLTYETLKFNLICYYIPMWI